MMESSLIKEENVAFIDIGTNSIRLLVVRLNPNGSITVLTIQKEVARLGEGVFSQEELSGEAIGRGVTICKQFVDLGLAYGVREFVAVATSATREAKNADQFLEMLLREANLDVRVVSGKEEARLIYRGVVSGLDIGTQRALFIDIGGGSTELSVGSQHDYITLESMKLGAIRVTNQFFRSGEEGSVSWKKYSRIQQYVRNVIVQPLSRIRKVPYSRVIGSSGTIQNLAEIASRLYPASSTPSRLRFDDLGHTIERLCSMTLEERRKVPGINPERADIIIGGAVILESVMEELGIAGIEISPHGLREGLLMEYLSRIPGFPHAEKISSRKRSVVQLGRSCRIDESHALTIVALSARLFDSAREAGLHSYTEKERTLLLYAAYLHDIGNFISFLDHHIHSAYIIRHADLVGFDVQEVGIMGEIARYHRKKFPRKKDHSFSLFDPVVQEQIRILSLFLRMAEHLDRTHAGRITDACLSKDQNGHVILDLEARGDCILEVWGVRSESHTIRKVFGSGFEVIVTEGAGDPLRGELPD
ncbi:Ppx/GppA family phosphatase [Methanocalculus taiwanensis]|uniref:Ppx/GppA family phosphatase n=1 Tax=Methanocalculus taiwanensis TaxID=106207 RepID=A0ABD4TIZ2_9EURY|nr:Ppx/GppA phosphatase family protein [Methanocalculus taiwanensis]MCQ1538421.1 Ppx/GppA family phosphatase [Methanocalculus taiwanensis]